MLSAKILRALPWVNSQPRYGTQALGATGAVPVKPVMERCYHLENIHSTRCWGWRRLPPMQHHLTSSPFSPASPRSPRKPCRPCGDEGRSRAGAGQAPSPSSPGIAALCNVLTCSPGSPDSPGLPPRPGEPCEPGCPVRPGKPCSPGSPCREEPHTGSEPGLPQCCPQ